MAAFPPVADSTDLWQLSLIRWEKRRFSSFPRPDLFPASHTVRSSRKLGKPCGARIPASSKATKCSDAMTRTGDAG